jgi:hypothetical protein
LQINPAKSGPKKEIHCPIHQETHRVFTKSVSQALGSVATKQDFPAEDLTPEYVTYDIDHDLDIDHGDLEVEVTPEIGDNYLSAEISIPYGGMMTKRHVTSQKRDIYGNPIGRAQQQYVIESKDGDETELTANLIAESIYVECDPDGNQYVLLDSISDHRRLDLAIQLVTNKLSETMDTLI